MVVFNRLKLCLSLGLVLGVSAPLQATVKKINQPFEVGGGVQLAELAGGSNANVVVYLAKTNLLSPALLFSVPITGGAPTDLSGVVAGAVNTFKVTADGGHVVYLATKDNALIAELYSVPVTGGASTKLNGNLVVGRNVLDFQLSRDGSQALYRADQVTDEVSELFVVPVIGGAATQVNPALVATADVTDKYDFSFDGSNAVYIADQDTDEMTELYSVVLGVPGSTKLNLFLNPTDDILDFKASPATKKVVYRSTPGAFDQLRTVDMDGNNNVQINPALVPGGSVKNLYDFISDGSQVIYVADQDTLGQDEIYIIPTSGGVIFANLNPPLIGDVSDFQFVQAKNAVVFRADQNTLNLKELFGAPLNDFSEDKVTKINPPLAADRSISSFKVSSNGEFLVYRSNQDNVSQIELYRVSFNGADAAKINPALVNGGNVVDFRISPDDTKILYRADQSVAGTIELFVADLVSFNADFNQDGKNDVLIQSQKTLQLLTRDGSGTFQAVNFPTPLAAKQKVLAAGDLDGDGKPEIVLGQGKSISIVSVEADLQQKPSTVTVPTLSKGFKLLASGRFGANPVFVTSKGKNLEVLVGTQKVTGQVEKGNKVFGFEKVNGQPSILLNKGSAISALALNGQSNQFTLGTAITLGSVLKGAKPSGVSSLISSNAVDIIARKGKEVRVYPSPVSGEGTLIFTAPKKVKVLGPR